MKCPNCGSVTIARLQKVAYLETVLQDIDETFDEDLATRERLEELPLLGKTYFCYDCEYRWDENELGTFVK